ncbi:MAG TPA: autotransporter-associated beta strand repeat-containing protein, partial [Rhodocyclaceae bacterium]|nr:autotransporter-associated beta strand repeat-containing protein [Rhodocyclaceae bacterium]
MAPKFEQMRLASPGWRRCGIAVAVALCFPIGATAGGTDPRFIFGGGRIVTGKNFTDVFNSPNAIIEWKTLSTAQKEILRFVQKNGDSWVMNRITGGDPSVFLGTLSSNGHVVIINQNGVAFGPSAQVNVAGLVVSGLNIANSDFLDGKRVFDGSAGAGRVLNEGSLRTLKGGSVVLVGGSVENRGVIEAPNGDILLLAGRSANLVDPAVPAIQVEVHAADNAAVNLGRMTGGHIGIYAGAIRHAGIVNANSAVVGENGKIVFKAVQGLVVEPGATVSASGSTGGRVTLESEGTTRIAGSVDARGTEGNGGAIRILGDAVSLEGNTRVDASGRTGGGTILVGGAYQGHGPERNASRTFVSAEAVLDASAGDRGDGGLVVVWSERATGFEGRIAARGGTRGGAGGSAEVSGKGFLDYRGTADLRAPKGRTGTLLLDPDSIDIGATADIDGLGGDLSGATILSTDFPGIASKITAAAVVAQLDAADVSLQALNNITVSSAIDASANTNSHGLTLQTTAAGSSITLNEGVKTKNGAIAILSGTGGITQAAGKSVDAGNATITLNGGGGNVTLQGTLTTTNATASAITVSNAAALQIGNMSAALGGTMTVSHSGAGSQTAGTVISSAARFAKAGAGTMTLSQANTHTGGTAVNAGTLVVSGGTALPDANGTVTVAAGATLDLANSEAIGALSGAGNVTLNANTLTTGGSGTSTTFSGAISGTGGMTKTGAGNFTVSGANAYTGATSVLAGTLTLGANNVLADTTAVSVAAGATLDLATFNDTVGSLTNAGTVAGTGTLTAATYNLNGGTIDGNLGAGTMAQLTGTTVLNGTAAAGTVNVTGGSLQLGAADRLSNAAAVSIAAGAVLDLSTANDTVGSLTSAGTLAGSGTLTATTYTLNGGSIDANLGAGTLTQSSGSTTLNGTVGALTVNV